MIVTYHQPVFRPMTKQTFKCRSIMKRWSLVATHLWANDWHVASSEKSPTFPFLNSELGRQFNPAGFSPTDTCSRHADLSLACLNHIRGSRHSHAVIETHGSQIHRFYFTLSFHWYPRQLSTAVDGATWVGFSSKTNYIYTYKFWDWMRNEEWGDWMRKKWGKERGKNEKEKRMRNEELVECSKGSRVPVPIIVGTFSLLTRPFNCFFIDT